MIMIKRLIPHTYHPGIGEIWTVVAHSMCGSGSYAQCTELAHQYRQRKIRKHRMQRRRNKFYRLHPEWNPKYHSYSNPSVELDKHDE